MNDEPTITISLKEFLDFATYNGLFDYIEVSEGIGNAIVIADPSSQYSIREYGNYNVIIWTLEGFIRESKRKQELNELSLAAATRIFDGKEPPKKETKQDIAKRIQDMLERLKE